MPSKIHRDYHVNIWHNDIYVIIMLIGLIIDFCNPVNDLKTTGVHMFDEPINVTDDAFEKTVVKADLPVIVDFWAPWCGPCKMVAPILEKIAKEYSGKVLVAKVNTDNHSDWANKFGVQGIPTMLFMAEGKVVHQQVGALPEPILRTILDQFLGVVNEVK